MCCLWGQSLIFAGTYFLFRKITGYQYNQEGFISVMFIGVNSTTFFGMPHRYSDSPECFTRWNIVSSFGSVISLVSIMVFYMVYDALKKQILFRGEGMG